MRQSAVTISCPMAVVAITLLLALPYPSNANVPGWLTECLNNHTRNCDGEQGEENFVWTCSSTAKNSPSCMSNAPISPPYVLLTKDPVQFITHPQDYVLDGHGSPISLNCRATGLSCFGQDDCPNYGWLQDGKTVPASDYSNTANGSVLRIDNFETDRAGQYTCVVRSGTSNMFTVASFSASVRNPLSKYLFFNWSHEVSRDFVVRTYDNPFRTVEMEIPIGSNVILDCTVVKPVSSDCHVWSASSSASNSTIIFSSSTCAHSFTLPVTGTASGNFNQTEYIVALPSGNLAVYNFSREQEGSYLCLIKRRTGLQQYKLYKLVAKNSSSALHFDVYPQNQTVVEGANVTLYCTVSGGRPPFVYRWWHGSDPISPHEIPYGSSVLFLERINFSQSGDYSCSVASNGGAGFVNKTAYLKVLAPIANVSIKLISPMFLLNSSSTGDILLPPTFTIGNLTLKCLLPFDQDVTYTWLFRGQPIAGNLFLASGNLLHVTVTKQSDVRSVYGSVQCLVEGVGGRDSVTLRILENGKPNPPGPILAHKSLPQTNYDYRYMLNWTESHSTVVPVSNYQLKLYIDGTGVCSVTVSSSCLVYNGLCNIILKEKDDSADNSIGMRVAAVAGSTSDYSVFSGGTPQLKHCLTFEENIPPVTDLKENLIAHYDTRVYDGFLSWKPIYQSYNASFTEDDEALLDYAYFVGLTCDGKAVIDMKDSIIKSPVLDLNHTRQLSLSCAMQCSWFVSVKQRRRGAEESKATKDFTTPSFPPNVSGTLQSVNWADHSGSSFELVWQPPSKDLKSSSCLLEDTQIHNLTVSYQYSEVDFSVNVTANYSEPIRIHLNQSDSCWTKFTVSVMFSNSAGQSPASNKLTLPSPQPSNITGFSSVTYDATTNNLSWTMDAGMHCFLKRDSQYSAYIQHFSLSIALPNHTNPNCSNVEEQKIIWTNNELFEGSFVKPDKLPSSITQFCMTVQFFGIHRLLKQQTHLVKVTKSGTILPSSSSGMTSATSPSTVPTSPPTLEPTGNGQISMTLLILLLVIMLLVIVIVSAIGIAFILKKCKNCTKQTNGVELRMLPEGSSPIDVLIPKDDNLCDSKSEHTTCNYLMGRFLEDSAKDQQDDYLESVSVVNAETERVELNRESQATVKSAQTVEVELHNLQEREIDDQTGKKILAENLDKNSKVTSWKEEPKKSSRERLSLKTQQPHTTLNIAPTPTLDQVKLIASTLQNHSTCASTNTYSSITSDYIANSCSTVESSSSQLRGAEHNGDMLSGTEKAVTALSDVLSYTSSQAPLLQPWTSPFQIAQSPACPSDVSPARSGYLSLDSPEVLKSTASPLHTYRQQPLLYSQSGNIPNRLEEAPFDLPPLEDGWTEENEDVCSATSAAKRSGYSLSVQQEQQPRLATLDGYITEKSLESFGTSTPLRLSTNSLMPSLSCTRDRYFSAEREHQTAPKGRKHSLQEQRPAGDGYISEEALRHHSTGALRYSSLSTSLSRHEGSFSDYLPHPSLEHTPRKFSAADSAMASASPPDSLSQASSEQSVFLPESEAEPLLSNPLPPPLSTHSPELARLRSDCSSGIFSSPTSPGAKKNTSSYFKSDPFTPYLSSLPSNRPAEKQRPFQLPMHQSDIQNKTQPHSATGMGLDYGYNYKRRYSTSTNYSPTDALNQRRSSAGYPTSYSSSSSRTLTPYSGAACLPALSPTRRTSLPSSPYSSYSASSGTPYQKLGSLNQSPATTSNHGPSFLSFMYSTKHQASNHDLPTAGTVEKPCLPPSEGDTKPTCLAAQEHFHQQNSQCCKAETLPQSDSHESLSSSFDSSYSPSSSLDDLSYIDSSSSLPQSCPPPSLPSFSAKKYSRSSTKDSDDWEQGMEQIEVERQLLLQ